MTCHESYMFPVLNVEIYGQREYREQCCSDISALARGPISKGSNTNRSGGSPRQHPFFFMLFTRVVVLDPPCSVYFLTQTLATFVLFMPGIYCLVIVAAVWEIKETRTVYRVASLYFVLTKTRHIHKYKACYIS